MLDFDTRFYMDDDLIVGINNFLNYFTTILRQLSCTCDSSESLFCSGSATVNEGYNVQACVKVGVLK